MNTLMKRKKIIVSVLFAVLALVTSPAAFAVSIPSEGVHADAFARHQDTSDGPVVVNDPANAEAQALVNYINDYAESHGRASLLGGVGSFCELDGAHPSSNPIQRDIVANSTASQVTNWIVTSDPAVTTADIDLSMFIDGLVAEPSGGAGIGPGENFAEVFFQANVYRSDDVASISVFEATARFDSSTGLSTSGPWGGAFNGGAVDYSEFFPAAFTVPTNENFGLEVILGTACYAVGPYELYAWADFLNTGSFELSTSTSGVTLVRISELTIEVEIDIKPGSDPNSINLSSAGVIPVAILSSDTFDATTVIPESVALAGTRVKMVGKADKYLCSKEDVNEDGLMDMVCKVYTSLVIIETGESVAVLEAETSDGRAIRGEDSVNIVPDN